MKKISKNIIIVIIIVMSCQLFGQNSWRSFILPGWGEKKLNLDQQSKNFMVAEGAIWLSFFTFSEFSDSYRNDYRNHGTIHADVDWENKNNRYAADVGNYNSLADYIQYQNWIGNFDNLYDDCSDCNWDWNNNNQERLKYDSWRNKSANYKEFQEFAIAALVLNRLISVFNIIKVERNNSITSDIIKEDEHSILLKINYHF